MAITNLLHLNLEDLTSFCITLGEKPFRAKQILHWIHYKGCSDFSQMDNISRSLKTKLIQKATIDPPTLISEHVSEDGSIKWLFDVGKGNAIETVYIPEDNRGTLCLSSQVGCAIGCTFCATGAQGFNRNLTSGEIIGQLWFARNRLYQKQPTTEKRLITNIVMMGMGEPLQNYTQLVSALQVMGCDHGYGVSRRRLTVSTSGLVAMMDRLAKDCPVALAVSLHAPDDQLRTQLVPLNAKYPLKELLTACIRYLDFAPRPFITMEYCLIHGVNDHPEQAFQLLRLLGSYPRLQVKMNLIPFNPFHGSRLQSPTTQSIYHFSQILKQAGIVTTLRKTRGDDIQAACGQLAGNIKDKTNIILRRQQPLSIEKTL